MKGDFTRDTFDRKKHFSSVRMQQGRVQLDADWNEQGDITNYRTDTGTLDAIGASGAPMGDAGFRITPGTPSGDLMIGAGRFYVDGILCENEAPVAISKQADLPGPAPIASPGLYIVYLDVWQRHLTAQEDDSMREVALGGPDTATRTKTVWQVKYLAVPDPGAGAACGAAFAEWDKLVAASTAALSARAKPAGSSTDPCTVPPGAGYRGLENQLYRVEIHKGGPLGGADPATFKWSRDNGSIVTRWLGPDNNVLKAASTGRDNVLNFAAEQFVELIDDTLELNGQPGALVKIDKVEGQILTVGGPVDRAKFPLNPRIRRWDSPGAIPVTQPATNDGYLQLESGLEVKFEGGQYNTGDYWLMPARVNTAGIEWPFTTPQPARGIRHHYYRLALVRFAGSTATVVDDCRRLFPPLTEINGLFYLGGDGQEAAPDPTQPQKLAPLPQPLRAGVANGIPNAKVRFTVVLGSGRLQGMGAAADVAVDAAGVASCTWELDGSTPVQQVEANLIDAVGKTVHRPVRYTANLSRADRVSYNPAGCSKLAGVTNVQDALDGLCRGDQVFHVVRVALGALDDSGRPAIVRDLPNDSNVQVEEFARGVLIECDEAADPAAVTRVTCFAVVDRPFSAAPPASTVPVPAGLSGFVPMALSATPRAENRFISLRPTLPALGFLLQELASPAVKANEGRLLVRLTLKGSFIWALNRPNVLLDGEAAGKPGRQRVDLVLPSGDGRRGGDFEMWFWLAPANVAVAGLSFNPAVITTVPTGAQASTGTVTLTAPAPANGFGVSLSASPAGLINVPPSVTVPPGAAAANFGVTTTAVVPSEAQVVVTASAAGSTQSATLTLRPFGTLARLAVTPATVIGGQIARGVLTLTAAPPQPLQVALTSANPALVTVPPAVVVPAGQNSATFDVTTRPVPGPTAVAITASAAGATQTTTVTLRPPAG